MATTTQPRTTHLVKTRTNDGRHVITLASCRDYAVALATYDANPDSWIESEIGAPTQPKTYHRFAIPRLKKMAKFAMKHENVVNARIVDSLEGKPVLRVASHGSSFTLIPDDAIPVSLLDYVATSSELRQLLGY